MADSSLYLEQRVFAHRGNALVLYVCFERLADRKFAVCQAEFLRDDDELPKRLAEISYNTAMVMLDEEQPSMWTFHPSLEEAIAAHDNDFADFGQWVANAQN